MDEKELLLHLRTCHGRFVFSLGDAKKELVDGVRHITEITVYVRFQLSLHFDKGSQRRGAQLPVLSTVDTCHS